MDGVKNDGSGWRENGTLMSNNRMVPDGTKVGKDWFGGYGGGFGWDCSPMRRGSSHSPSRKAASAIIAKIPLPLSRHVARWYLTEGGGNMSREEKSRLRVAAPLLF